MTFDGARARPAKRKDCALIDASVRNMEASWWVETRVSPGPRARLGATWRDLRIGRARRTSEFRAARSRGGAFVSSTQRGARSALLECDLGEAAQLSAVQLIDSRLAQQLDRANADAQMLVDALAVEMVGHPGQLDLAVQGLVADAEQGSVRDAEAETVRGDGRALHVERDRAALAEAALGRAERMARRQQLPVAVVGARDRSGAVSYTHLTLP